MNKNKEIIINRAHELALEHFERRFEIEAIHLIGDKKVILIDEYLGDFDLYNNFRILIDEDYNVLACDNEIIKNPGDILKKFRLELVTGKYDEYEEDQLDFNDIKHFYVLMIIGGLV